LRSANRERFQHRSNGFRQISGPERIGRHSGLSRTCRKVFHAICMKPPASMAPAVGHGSEENYVLPLGLAVLQGQYETNWSWLMAGAVMSALPVIILHLFAQCSFIEGIAKSGWKG
jgi:hypothetical protein